MFVSVVLCFCRFLLLPLLTWNSVVFVVVVVVVVDRETSTDDLCFNKKSKARPPQLYCIANTGIFLMRENVNTNTVFYLFSCLTWSRDAKDRITVLTFDCEVCFNVESDVLNLMKNVEEFIAFCVIHFYSCCGNVIIFKTELICVLLYLLGF